LERLRVMEAIEPRRFEPICHDLASIWSTIWDELHAGTRSGLHPWHLGVLGTLNDAQGSDTRMVVLRQVDPAARSLCFHTDLRSPKVRQLRQDGRVSWLFYHPGERVQLRMQAEARLHVDDAIADERWAASSLDSRRCYLAPASPGTDFDQPFINLPDDLRGGPPTQARSEAGRVHFAAVITTVSEIDWYFLHADGHLRCHFRCSREGWQAVWKAS
jgi:pyridoxamine 5'-phosphate oxidase